jgi:hypothetical protein
MKRTVSLLALLALLVVGRAGFAAEETGPQGADTKQAAGAPPAAGTPAENVPVLTPEEKAEKEARKACKIKICDILATKNPVGDDVSCDIVKTWRGEDIVKMLGGKIDWPWGNATCQSKLELKRAPLAKAMSEAAYTIALPSQKVRCTLAQKDKGEPYVVEIAMAPKVTFKDGKASEGSVNWGEASAPLLIYPLIYASTGLDNSTNVLGPDVVTMVNEFATKKCAEVKTELPGTKPN